MILTCIVERRMRLRQSLIPLIPGNQTSTYRLALPTGNSLVSNSSALLKTNTLNLPQSLWPSVFRQSAIPARRENVRRSSALFMPLDSGIAEETHS